MTPSANAQASRAASGVPMPDPDEEREIRQGPQGRHQLGGRALELVAGARHAVGRHAVDEPPGCRPRSRCRRSVAVPGAASSDGVDVARLARRRPAPPPRPRGGPARSPPRTPAAPQPRTNAVEAAAEDRVHVGHDGDRDRRPPPRRSWRGRRPRCAPALQRDPRRLLDHAAVHHGIRVRDADLDRVGARGRERRAAARRRRPGSRPSRTGRTPSARASRAARSAASSAPIRSSPSAARTVSRSLSPRPERQTSTARPRAAAGAAATRSRARARARAGCPRSAPGPGTPRARRRRWRWRRWRGPRP